MEISVATYVRMDCQLYKVRSYAKPRVQNNHLGLGLEHIYKT